MAAEKLVKEVQAQEARGHCFWPYHVIDQLIQGYLLLGLIITLSVLIPFKLHEPADPLNTPIGIKPEWYFLPSYQMLKYVPKGTGLLLFLLTIVLLTIWPLVDAVIESRAPGRRLHRKVGWIALVLVLGLGFLGWISERIVVIGGKRFEIDLRGIPHPVHEVPNLEGAPAPERPPEAK